MLPCVFIFDDLIVPLVWATYQICFQSDGRRQKEPTIRLQRWPRHLFGGALGKLIYHSPTSVITGMLTIDLLFWARAQATASHLPSQCRSLLPKHV